MQSSHLTRRVFRALLNNEPVCFSPRRFRVYSISALRRGQKNNNNVFGHGQSRTFFSFTSTTKTPEVPISEVGLQTMSELSKAKINNGRTPPYSALCKAYQKFFEARAEEPGIVTEFHAKQLVTTYEHLRRHRNDEDVNRRELEAIESKDFMELVLYVLSHASCHGNSHRYVRRIAFHAYGVLSGSTRSIEMSTEAFLAWIRINAFYGNPYQARTALMKEWPKIQRREDVADREAPWLWILHGMALDRNAAELVKSIHSWDRLGHLTLRPQQHQELIVALLEQGQLDAARVLHDCPLPEGQATPTATGEIGRAYLLAGNKTEADELFDRLSTSQPTSETRDILLLMAAAKGTDGPGLAHDLNRWCQEDPSVREGLSVSCVNDLIRYAYVLGNKALALEYSNLIATWGLEADAETQILLELEPRILDSNVNGIVKALIRLDENETSANLSVHMRYRLIKLLCTEPHNDEAFDEVSKLLDPLLQDGTRLEPEILTTLTRTLGERHDWEALSQLLRPRIGDYSMWNERPLIQNALIEFIQKADEENEEVWNAYDLVRIAFPEISTERRLEIMKCFFNRGMTEEACQVFGHLRHGPTSAQRPTPEAYVTCFLGLARATDWDNIKLIRNMLKVDVNIEMTTRLRNAVMLALATCQRPEEAMDEFREILRSDEGPSINSLTIFFKVCESDANGVVEAKKMLSKISALEIPLNRSMYLGYIKALAAQGERDLVIEALEQTEIKIGQLPDKDMIARIYNVCAHEYAQEGIEEWTKKTHPSIWQDLEKVARTQTEEGLRLEEFEDDLSSML